MSGLKYRRDIDGLRTLAVVPVVLGHAGIAWLPGGFVGVDVFFVISGYLISTILLREMEEGKYSIAHFYERRVRRILPALFFLLFVVGAFALFFFPPPMLDNFAKSASATLLFVSNALFYYRAEDYFAVDSLTEPLLHTWSLAVEEQFYIVFPLLLWLLLRWKRPALKAVVAGLALVSFAIAVATVPKYQTFAFFLPFSRVWELGVGVILALGIIPGTRSQGLAEAVAAAGLLAILGSILFIDESMPFPGIAALPPVFGAAAIIWAGEQRRSQVGRLLSTPLFVGIGLVSYSLYLWHWPILVAFRLRLGTNDLSLAWATGAIVLAFIMAWFSWRFVELPFRRRGPAEIPRKMIFAFSGAGTLAFIAVCGFTVATNGFRFRASHDLLAVLSAQTPQRWFANCSAQDDFCDLGDAAAGPARVLIWGDSHAATLGSGFNTYFEERGMKAILAARLGCTPIIGVFRLDYDTAPCVDHNAATLDYVRSTPSIRTVVLVGRWPLFVEGNRVPGEPGSPALLRVLGDAHTEGVEANALAFAHGFEKTIDALQQTGSRIVIIGGIPEIGRSVPDAMALKLTMGAPKLEGPTLAATQARQARANSIISAGLDPGQVVFVDPVTLMCDERCPVEQDGVPLYRDDDHLSDAGAALVVPELLDQVPDSWIR